MRAILNGTLTNDGGEVCSCGFEWGVNAAYGNVTSGQYKNTGESFSFTLNDLAPGVYHFRAYATNSAGTTYGADATFGIASGLPVVSTLDADKVGESVATLHGYLENDLGYPTSVWFEWGMDTTYGNVTLMQNGTAPYAFQQFVASLHDGTLYHFRAVAQNRNGIGYGGDNTFITVTRGLVSSPIDDGILALLS